MLAVPGRLHSVGASSTITTSLSGSSARMTMTVPTPTSSTCGRLCGSRSQQGNTRSICSQEAQATIRDLQTKMADERLCRDEALQRVVTEIDDAATLGVEGTNMETGFGVYR